MKNEHFFEKRCKAIFLFQDVLSDANLNNKTILQMKNYLNKLSNQIYIYPGVEITDTFGSKKYYETLVKKIPWSSLPHSRVLSFPNYKSYTNDYKIKKIIWKNVQSLWKIFDKVVVKKGYSYEGKQVVFLDKNEIKNYGDFTKKFGKMNFKKFWGKITNSRKLDNGITRYYILQGFNEIVTKRENEYRIFFINGIASYIGKGSKLPNICISDAWKNPLEKEILKFAAKLYLNYIPMIWKNKLPPILFRIDVSYAIEPQFQDKYSIKINDKLIRIYTNEMEIDPTSYFYNNFQCNDKNFTSENIQKIFANSINNYISKLNHLHTANNSIYYSVFQKNVHFS